jgi:hypothetical protein
MAVSTWLNVFDRMHATTCCGSVQPMAIANASPVASD